MTTIEQDAVLAAISKKLVEAERRIYEAQNIFSFYMDSRNEEKQSKRSSILEPMERPVKAEEPECVE